MSSILAAFDGRLGAAPQMRTAGQGQPWASFSVAVGGDEAEWVSVSAFGQLVPDRTPRQGAGVANTTVRSEQALNKGKNCQI
jgi:Single-strand binding protein family